MKQEELISQLENLAKVIEALNEWAQEENGSMDAVYTNICNTRCCPEKNGLRVMTGTYHCGGCVLANVTANEVTEQLNPVIQQLKILEILNVDN